MSSLKDIEIIFPFIDSTSFKLLSKYLNEKRKYELSQYLQHNPCKISGRNNWNILMKASYYGNPYTLEYICKYLYNLGIFREISNTIDKNGCTSLELSVQNRRYCNMYILIKYGININILTSEGCTFIDYYLFESVYMKKNRHIDEKLIFYLYQNTMNITIFTLIFMYKLNLLKLSYLRWYISTFKLEINRIDINYLSYSALHYACSWNDVNLAKLLLQNRANINVRNKYDFTPIFYCYDDNLAKLLILYKANLGLYSNTGFLPYNYGCLIFSKPILLHSIREGLVENFDMIHQELLNDEEIQREILFSKRNNILFFFEWLQHISYPNNHILQYLFNPFIEREILIYL